MKALGSALAELNAKAPDDVRTPKLDTIAAADVSNRSQLTMAIDSIRDRLGAIDLLVANAGISRPDYLDRARLFYPYHGK